MTSGAPLPPAASPVRLIEADRVVEQPWRNGGGVTRELLRLPADTATWDLRISLADIDADGPFSAFPGIDRHFAVIEGAGVRLQFRHRIHVLVPGDAPLAFDGIEAPACTLADGSTRDLNVMADRRYGRATLSLADPDRPWIADAAQSRGVFTVRPVRLRRAGADSFSLPARTLVWCEGGDASAWTLEAPAHTDDGRVQPPPLAYWITWQRRVPGADAALPPEQATP